VEPGVGGGRQTAPLFAMATVCEKCGDTFASRNALFRHLRHDDACRTMGEDASTSSVRVSTREGVHKTSVGRVFDGLGANENVVGARGVNGARASATRASSRKRECDMTKDEVRALNERRRARAAKRKYERQNGDARVERDDVDPASELWIGGLRGRAGTMKGLRDTIWRAMPTKISIPQPGIKYLKRRGYRKEREWIGYGFVTCRCPEEANALREEMDGKRIKGPDDIVSVLRVLPAVRKRGVASEGEPVSGPERWRILAPGEHPDAREIFMAWTAKDLEIRAQTRSLDHNALIDDAKTFTSSYTSLRGVAVDAAATKSLRDELLRTKWPTQTQRRSVKSDGYLVLKRETSPRDPYAALKAACEALMMKTDPSFPYDSLAITKNFISSAHVDRDDKSFQYAMSFGDFTGGGELCVESRDGATRWMIDTRERLARFDGRSVHWVRGYDGDRFSVVWYVNRDASFTPQRFDVDATFVDETAPPPPKSSSLCVVQ